MFKKGDKVRCVEGSPPHLILGAVYTVTEVFMAGVAVQGVVGSWYKTRFSLIPAETLPTSSEERKKIPLCTGVFDAFPAALIELAKLAKLGNEKHNPGEPLHWSRDKSDDHPDALARHLLERGTIASDGTRHSAALAWRALANLQLELEAEGAPKARGAK